MLPALGLATLLSTVAASPVRLSPVTSEAAKRNNNVGWKWAETTQWFSFGDSYTTTAQNVTDGTIRPNVGTSSNGLVWVQWLVETYAVKPNIKLWNSAWSAAVVDNTLLTPMYGRPDSIIEQVDKFEIWAGKNGGAWDQTTSICSMWIGINDVGLTFKWTNISQPEFYDLEHDRIREQLTRLHDLQACSAYVLLTVPPISLAPLYLEQGPDVTAQLDHAVDLWNTRLRTSAAAFQEKVGDEVWVGVYETEPVFRIRSVDAVIDNAEALGFTNATGFSTSYPILWDEPVQTENNNTQLVDQGLLPQGSYLWMDNLHPGWAFHGLFAHALSTFLGAINVF